MTDREREQAIKEAHNIAASEAYFEVRAGVVYPQPHTIFDAGFSRGWDAATTPLLERIAALTTENTRLEGLVYSPGLWRCAKCKFTLVQRNLNAHSGTITARDQPGDKCPNCDVNLWRVTERENALENYEVAESLQVRLNALEAKIAQRVPDGFELVAVKGLGPLVSALERAESKGYMPFAFEEEWDGFDYQNVSAAPAAPEQQEPKPCSLCGADEPFSGACGGGRDNPSALCYRASNAQQAEAQEPVISTEHGPWVASNLHEGETYCKRCLLRSCFRGARACNPHITYPTPPAKGISQETP